MSRQLSQRSLLSLILLIFAAAFVGCSPEAGLEKIAKLISPKGMQSLAPEVPSFYLGSDQRVDEDAGPQTVTAWATELSSGMTEPTQQGISFLVVENTNAPLFAVQPAVDEQGTLTFTPAPDTHGIAEITLVATNEQGDRSAPATFTITVVPVEDVPFALAQTVRTEEDLVTKIVLQGHDADGDTLTFQIFDDGLRGTLSEITAAGPVTATVFFTPETDAAYSTSFTFTVYDGKAVSEPAKVSLVVKATNDRPEVLFWDQPWPEYPASATTFLAVTEVTETIPYRFFDAEAFDENNDARSPYFFRISVNEWPNHATAFNTFRFRKFDINEISKDTSYDSGGKSGVIPYIQFSSSVWVGNYIMHGLEFELIDPGDYVIEFVVIDNGFLGSCPSGLVRPDPAERESFVNIDIRREIGRDGDLVNGDPFRCIRESSHLLTISYSGMVTPAVRFFFSP